jgi:hypothetical protein
MNSLCPTRYKNAVGSEAIIVAQRTTGSLRVEYCPIKVESVAIRGRTSELTVKVRPNNKSFQIQVNWNRNAAPSAGHESGKKILVKTKTLEAPSICAASTTSLEIESM